MLRCLFLLLILAVTARAQVPVGATKKEVIDKLGWPTSTSSSDDREMLNYPAYSVLLENGRVVKLSLKPQSPQKRPIYQPPAPVKPQTDVVIPSSRPKQTPPIVQPQSQPAVKQPQATPTAPIASTPRPVVTQPPVLRDKPGRVSPQPDPMARAKSFLLWFGAGLGLLLGLLHLLGSHLKKERADRARYSKSATVSDTGIPPVMATQQQRRPKPDPLTAGWSMQLLKEIEWHRFEQVVAAYERELGNDAELTDFGPDGGIDVQVFKRGSRTPLRVIQCKAFNNQKVGVELVRSFYGAMTLQKAQQGAFYTTSSFSGDALIIGMANGNLELVDGEMFLNRIRSLPLSAQLRLFEVATEGDYTTPTCPSCGVKMILRTAGTGRSEGSDFWGCRNFPRCKSRIQMGKAT